MPPKRRYKKREPKNKTEQINESASKPKSEPSASTEVIATSQISVNSSTLQITSSPVTLAARRISHNAKSFRKKIKFVRQLKIRSISPLEDKPGGYVRLPFEGKIQGTDILEKKKKKEVVAKRVRRKPLDKDAAKLPNRKSPSASPILIRPESLNETLKGSFLSDMDVVEVESDAEKHDHVPNPILELNWSQDEKDIFDRATSSRTKYLKNDLWITSFCAEKPEDYFGNNVYVNDLCNWFSDWKKKFLNDDENTKKTKKQKRRNSDDDFELSNVDIINPLVIIGPCGSGKTSSIHSIGRENHARVIEISSADRRNGATLEQKLDGALKTHYVKKQSNDIRNMFNKISENKSSCEKIPKDYEFSIILIDDCDIIYANDGNFWPSLKTICAESRIPIVLTCTNYVYVKEMMAKQEIKYRTLHFELPTKYRFCRYLRPWLAGYISKLINNEALSMLIESYKSDVRAVLNALQWNGGDLAKAEQPENNLINMKNFVQRSRVLAQLDSAYGKKTDVGWMANSTTELDFSPAPYIEEAFSKNINCNFESLEFPEALEIALYPFYNNQNFSHLLNFEKSRFKPIQAIQDARLRLPNQLYSLKSVSLDYIPCLFAINEKFLSGQNVGGSRRKVNGTSSNSNNIFIRRRNHRTLHPFDVICSEKGYAIDILGKLKHSIGDYRFSNSFYPTYNIK